MQIKQYIVMISAMVFCELITSPSYAQKGSKSTPYVNLELANQRYAFHYPSASSTVLALNPVCFSVGYSFTPKFALQAGILPNKSENEYVSSGTTAAGVPTGSVTWDKVRAIALPVLGRYTLGHPENKRFNVDVLFGPVFVRSKAQVRETETTNGVTEIRRNTTYSGWNTIYTGGGGGRYLINKHFQVIGNVSLNKNTEIRQKYFTGNSLNLTSSLGLGIQYRLQ